ncbi:MAG: hypothetical protein JST20_11125 [Bacteroidetes bacterium]|nr:hypothetical protein [Bacteroidota bacterium]
MKYLTLLFILILIINSAGCSQDTTDLCTHTKEYGEYLVVSAVEQLIDQKKMSFATHDYDKNRIIIKQVLCSPDTTKIFSIIVVYENNAERNPYFSTCILGSRENGDTTWSFTPFNKIMANFDDPISAANEVCGYYYNYFKGDGIIADRYKFEYSPLEKEFWNSLLFQKGIDGSSLYFYQTDFNVFTHKFDIVKPMVTCIMK